MSFEVIATIIENHRFMQGARATNADIPDTDDESSIDRREVSDHSDVDEMGQPLSPGERRRRGDVELAHFNGSGLSHTIRENSRAGSVSEPNTIFFDRGEATPVGRGGDYYAAVACMDSWPGHVVLPPRHLDRVLPPSVALLVNVALGFLLARGGDVPEELPGLDDLEAAEHVVLDSITQKGPWGNWGPPPAMNQAPV